MEAKVLSIKNSFAPEWNDDVAHLVGKTGLITSKTKELYTVKFEGEDEVYYWHCDDLQIIEE